MKKGVYSKQGSRYLSLMPGIFVSLGVVVLSFLVTGLMVLEEYIDWEMGMLLLYMLHGAGIFVGCLVMKGEGGGVRILPAALYCAAVFAISLALWGELSGKFLIEVVVALSAWLLTCILKKQKGSQYKKVMKRASR